MLNVFTNLIGSSSYWLDILKCEVIEIPYQISFIEHKSRIHKCWSGSSRSITEDDNDYKRGKKRAPGCTQRSISISFFHGYVNMWVSLRFFKRFTLFNHLCVDLYTWVQVAMEDRNMARAGVTVIHELPGVADRNLTRVIWTSHLCSDLLIHLQPWLLPFVLNYLLS